MSSYSHSEIFMLRKVFILIIFFIDLLFSINVFASEYNEGLLWEIEAPNGAKSHLFGTMHLVCDDADRVFDLVSNQIKNSRMVFIEYDYDKTEESFISQNILNTKISLSDTFSPQEIKKLKILMKKNQISFSSLEHAAPFLVYFYLTNPGSVKSSQIDFKISDLAKKLGIPLNGLESTEAVLSRIISFDNIFFTPILKNAIDNPDYFTLHINKIKALYRSENLNDMLASLNEDSVSTEVNKSFLNSLVYERNMIMFNSVYKEMNEGKVFIAVGAAHLAGEKGLLQLFKKAGYKISRQNLNL